MKNCDELTIGDNTNSYNNKFVADHQMENGTTIATVASEHNKSPASSDHNKSPVRNSTVASECNKSPIMGPTVASDHIKSPVRNMTTNTGERNKSPANSDHNKSPVRNSIVANECNKSPIRGPIVASDHNKSPTLMLANNHHKSPQKSASSAMVASDNYNSPLSVACSAHKSLSPKKSASNNHLSPGSGSPPKCSCTAIASTARRSLFGDSKKRRRVDKFYQKQCNLVESFEQDSKQIQNFQQRRALQSQNSCDSRHPSGEQVARQPLIGGAATVDVHDDAAGGECCDYCGDCGDDDAFVASPDARLLDESFCVKSVGNGTAASPLPPPQPHIRIVRSDSSRHSGHGEDGGSQSRLARAARRLALFTLAVNLGLTIAKAVASYLSGSLSIISSLVDSLVDITSGLVIWLTGRAIKKHDPYLYPVGRTRLEPVALVIVSVIMAVASVQMIVQSAESIYQQRIHPRVDWPTIAIMCTTVLVKIFLYCLCSRLKSDPSSRVLAQDHRNDCLSNSIALLCAFGAHKFWLYLDPIGAIVVALYIAITWYRTGKEHLIMLSGRSAKPEFINRIIKVCIDHDSRIQFIDTVYVYHFGTRFLVEVHIVLDQDMPLKEAHDISESLQNSIESLPDVERAFLHVDYEFEHKPQDEHKVP